MIFLDKLFKLIAKRKPAEITFTIEFPDKRVKVFGSGKEVFRVQIKTSKVYQAAATKGFLGVGEQYMLGNLEIHGNLDIAMITMVHIFASDGNNLTGNLLFQTLENFKKLAFPETKDKALKDIGTHYDISNDFYQTMLDPTMTYSCAYFKTGSDSLEKAQLQKYEHISRKLQLKKGETLLDVGCGWGGMLIYAAQNYGVKGYGVTLSKNQHAFAAEQIKKLKLSHLIKIDLKDYRDIQGNFDKFVSIGMFEHVTEKYYRDFFQMIKRNLKPQGIGILHTIGCNDPKGHYVDPWLATYIFPGAYIPAASEIFSYAARNSLYPQDFENLRQHYALTLKSWITNYRKVYAKTAQERGEKFARMWLFYLTACRASFVVGTSQLWQLTFTNGITNNYPLTRKNLYI